MSLTGFKEKAFEWLFQQGVSTVLLIAILVGLWHVTWRGIPYVMTETKAHIQEINKEHSKNVERISSSFDRATDAFNQQAERDRQLLESVIRSRPAPAASPAH